MKTTLLATLLLTPIVAIVDWEVMVFVSLWFLVWLLLPLAGVGMVIVGRLQRRSSVTRFGVALALAGVIGGAVARQLSLSQVATNRGRGEQVAAALEAHRQARGSYPESLAELVPNFLVDLPVPSIGAVTIVPWRYSVSPAGYFVLGYQASRQAMLFYEKGEWSALPVPW